MSWRDPRVWPPARNCARCGFSDATFCFGAATKGSARGRFLCVRGAKPSGGRIQDGRLACPCHGGHYDASGRCVLIPAHPSQPPPARARPTTYRVAERHGLIWVCPGTPKNEILVFPEADDLRFEKQRPDLTSSGLTVRVLSRISVSQRLFRIRSRFDARE
jgi:hypothetical protein